MLRRSAPLIGLSMPGAGWESAEVAGCDKDLTLFTGDLGSVRRIFDDHQRTD